MDCIFTPLEISISTPLVFETKQYLARLFEYEWKWEIQMHYSCYGKTKRKVDFIVHNIIEVQKTLIFNVMIHNTTLSVYCGVVCRKSNGVDS